MNITTKELEAIEELVDYVYEDEENHYNESDEKDKSCHIFKSIKILEGIVAENKNNSTIKQLKELLERFGITPTPKNIKIASSFNFQNLEISLENAAIGEFEKMRSAVIKRNRLKI